MWMAALIGFRENISKLAYRLAVSESERRTTLFIYSKLSLSLTLTWHLLFYYYYYYYWVNVYLFKFKVEPTQTFSNPKLLKFYYIQMCLLPGTVRCRGPQLVFFFIRFNLVYRFLRTWESSIHNTTWHGTMIRSKNKPVKRTTVVVRVSFPM